MLGRVQVSAYVAADRTPAAFKLVTGVVRHIIAAAALTAAALLSLLRLEPLARALRHLHSRVLPLNVPPALGGTAPHQQTFASKLARSISVLAATGAVAVAIGYALVRQSAPIEGGVRPLHPAPQTVRVARHAGDGLLRSLPMHTERGDAVDHVTMAEVQNTLLAWAEAKALALGPQHDLAALDNVLTGPMLRGWHRKAVQHREHDYHWSYKPTHFVVRGRLSPCRSVCRLLPASLPVAMCVDCFPSVCSCRRCGAPLCAFGRCIAGIDNHPTACQAPQSPV